jgi:flagellar biosynthetic protein FliR
MINIYEFPEGQIIAFALVFLRILAFIFTWPVFGVESVPGSVKILLSLLLAFILFPVIKFQNAEMLKISADVILLAAREVCLGLFLGFLVRMYFFSISVAGEIVAVSMGLSSAQLFNPGAGSYGNIMEHFHLSIATLIFLGLNGHHMFLTGLAESFNIIKVSSLGFHHEGFIGITDMIKDVFIMGLKISAPVLVAIFLTNIAMAILGRAVPQINILITSMSVTILVGFAVMFLALPLFTEEMHQLLDLMTGSFFKMMRVI